MTQYKCRICPWTGELPQDAVEISGRMYRFGGSVHSLQKIRPFSEPQHNRWHKSKPRLFCPWCFSNPKPIEEQLQSAVTQVLIEPTDQPEPPPSESTSMEPEINQVDEEILPLTTMAAAFRAANQRSKNVQAK